MRNVLMKWMLVIAVLAIAVMGLGVPLSGCNTVKETRATIAQDPEHAPENDAYFAQLLLESVVEKMSKAVLNTGTPKEIADGIKRALPATVVISDGLKAAREDYILRKAEISALESAGKDTASKRTELQKALGDMRDAQSKADTKRGALINEFGNRVSFSLEETAARPMRAMPFPLLLFLPSIFGTLASLAAQMAPKSNGGQTIAHYAGLISSLISQGVTAGIDMRADLKAIQAEMQQLVDEDRAATNEEMAASNERLKAAVAAALAHDTSGHPSIQQ